MDKKPAYVWIFNSNRRIYGSNRSAPIWREHWVRKEIIGETSRSWVLAGYPELKIPKKSKTPLRHVAWSEKELDQLCWLHEHRYQIVRNVERLPSAELIKIAKLIGYEPLPPD